MRKLKLACVTYSESGFSRATPTNYVYTVDAHLQETSRRHNLQAKSNVTSPVFFASFAINTQFVASLRIYIIVSTRSS